MAINDYVFRIPMDEGSGATATDSVLGVDKLSHANSSGTITGNFTWIAGKLGAGAIRFDGSTEYGDFGNNMLAVLVAAGHTTAGTIHTLSIGFIWKDAGDGVVIGSSGSSGYGLYVDTTNVYYNAGGGANFVTVAHGGLSNTAWTHYTVTRNGTSVQFYKNGAALGSAQTLGTNTALEVRSIGAYGGGTFPATVDVDDFRIYDRVLNSTEVNDLYVEFAPTVTLTQVTAQFRNDDGSETTATPLSNEGVWASQDLGVNVRVRVQINAVNNPDSIAYVLRAQKSAGSFLAIPVGATNAPTLSIGALGTGNYTATNSLGSIAYPAHTAFDALVLIVFQKPLTANGGGVTTPSGWSLRLEMSGATDGDTGGYTTTAGVADQGNCNIYVYSKDTVTGSEVGNITITNADNDVCGAFMLAITGTDTNTLSYAGSVGKDTTGGNVSITTNAGFSIQSGDALVFGMVIPTDVTTPGQFSAEAISQSGTTFGAVSEKIEMDSTVGNDIGGFICTAMATAGSGSGAVTFTATAGGTTTNVRGPGFVLRVRATPVNNEIFISPSANITAGGEATTAQMTSPGGSFTAGRMWDDENGTDAIDIGNNGYTELEWCVQVQSPAVRNDFWNFRVYAAGVALDSYPVISRLTAGRRSSPPPHPTRRATGALLSY